MINRFPVLQYVPSLHVMHFSATPLKFDCLKCFSASVNNMQWQKIKQEAQLLLR